MLGRCIAAADVLHACEPLASRCDACSCSRVRPSSVLMAAGGAAAAMQGSDALIRAAARWAIKAPRLPCDALLAAEMQRGQRGRQSSTCKLLADLLIDSCRDSRAREGRHTHASLCTCAPGHIWALATSPSASAAGPHQLSRAQPRPAAAAAAAAGRWCLRRRHRAPRLSGAWWASRCAAAAGECREHQQAGAAGLGPPRPHLSRPGCWRKANELPPRLLPAARRCSALL